MPVRGSGQLGTAPRRRWNTQLIGQLVRFSAIGVVSTVVQLGLFLLLRNEVGALTANLISLVLSTVANTEANRRITFGIRGRTGAIRHQLQGLAVFALSLALSSGALALLGMVAPTAGASAELVVLIAANALPVVARFALLRAWVFGARPSA
jgi:putative flippase GtrA